MKKILSKFICFFIVAITAFTAFACQKQSSQTSSPSSEDSVVEEPGEVLMMLADNGKSDYRVLISENAEVVEKTAANEFVKYIQATTGAKLPIVTDDTVSANVNGKFVSLGETTLFKKAKIDNTNLNTDGYVYKTVGNCLFIAGEKPKATLFGVYGYLEYEMGCKFLTAHYEYIPSYDKYELREVDERSVPAIAHRTVFYSAMSTTNTMYLAPKNGYTVMRTTDPSSIGGSFMDFTHTDMIHAMSYLVSFEENRYKHPQWYGTAGSYMPCLSNGLNADTGELDINDREKDANGNLIPGTTYIEAWIQKCIEILEYNHECEYLTFGQPDSSDPLVCNCSKCKSQLSKLNYNRSAQYMIWTNTVAKEIQKWIAENQPGRKMRFARTAYAWSEGAPVVERGGVVQPINELCRPRDDVSIWWIPINSCYIHEICDESCSTNSNGSGESWKNWKQICNNFLVFDYNVNYTDFLSYFPNMNVLQRNLQEYVNAGVKGYLLEGAVGCEYYYQQDMEAWVAGKLMWNPDRDVVSLVSEFNRYYYGEEAGKIADELLWFLEGHFNHQSGGTRCARIYSGSAWWMVSETTLNKVFLDSCYNYFKRMRKVYADDTTLTEKQKAQYEENLQRFEIMVDYMKYKHYSAVTKGSETEKYKFMVNFFDKLELLEIQRFSENGSSTSSIRLSLGY